MPILGPLSINLGITGSEATASGINFFYAGSGNYLNPTITGSIGSIRAYVKDFDTTGATGELAFFVPSKESSNKIGVPVLTLGATGSLNEPRIGIGFTGSEKPIKAFDIKSVADTSVGTELLIRSARSTRGADIGDTAGTINFAIDTGSFLDVSTTGSVGKIKGIVTSEDSSGIQGKLAFELFKGGLNGQDVINYGYDISDNNPVNFSYLYTGAMEIRDFSSVVGNPNGKAVLEMRDTDNNVYFQAKSGNFISNGSGSLSGSLNLIATGSEINWSFQPSTPSIGSIYRQFNNGTTLLFETVGSFSTTYTITTGSEGSKTGILLGNIIGGTQTATASLVSIADTNTTTLGNLDFEFSASSNNLTGSARKLQIYGITTNPNVTLSGIIQNV